MIAIFNKAPQAIFNSIFVALSNASPLCFCRHEITGFKNVENLCEIAATISLSVYIAIFGRFSSRDRTQKKMHCTKKLHQKSSVSTGLYATEIFFSKVSLKPFQFRVPTFLLHPPIFSPPIPCPYKHHHPFCLHFFLFCIYGCPSLDGDVF